MFSRFFKRELTDEQKAEAVQTLRAGFPNEEFADATLRRFLVAREWDQAASTEMLQKHVEWKKATLPMQRTSTIEGVLESGRIRVLRRGKLPVICVDFMWGKFLLEGFSEDDIINAQISVLEDVLAEADAACQDGGEAAYIAVSTGGPPPKEFVKKISPIFETNYPERLGSAIIYPIPRWIEWVANAILLLVPARTREKFLMYSEEAAFLEKTGLAAEDLPEDLKGGIEGTRKRAEEAMKDEKARDQLPEEYKQAVNNPDANLQVMMSQAAC
jgi:hypothetical protein